MRKYHSLRIAAFALAAACPTLGSAAQPEVDKATDKPIGSLPMSRLSEAFQMMLVTQNQCINYVYDKNGNRTSVANSAFTSSAPKWGTSSYLCFTWSAN